MTFFEDLLRLRYFSLCEFAYVSSDLAAEALNFNKLFTRQSIKETSITDMIMIFLKILENKGLGIYVDFPDETVTGADMEWNFVDVGNKITSFSIYIQAKRLYLGREWEKHYYNEIFQKSDCTYQVDTLTKETRKDRCIYPLYMFYNHGDVCEELAERDDVNVDGINLMNGYVVEALVKIEKKRTPYARPINNKLGVLHPMFFLLKDFLCFPLLWGRYASFPEPIPHPQDICDRLIKQREKVLNRLFPNWDSDTIENRQILQDFFPNLCSKKFRRKKNLQHIFPELFFEGKSKDEKEKILKGVIPEPEVCTNRKKIKSILRSHIETNLRKYGRPRNQLERELLKFFNITENKIAQIKEGSQRKDFSTKEKEKGLSHFRATFVSLSEEVQR